jgi:hypothetical protein
VSRRSKERGGGEGRGLLAYHLIHWSPCRRSSEPSEWSEEGEAAEVTRPSRQPPALHHPRAATTIQALDPPTDACHALRRLCLSRARLLRSCFTTCRTAIHTLGHQITTKVVVCSRRAASAACARYHCAASSVCLAPRGGRNGELPRPPDLPDCPPPSHHRPPRRLCH